MGGEPGAPAAAAPSSGGSGDESGDTTCSGGLGGVVAASGPPRAPGPEAGGDGAGARGKPRGGGRAGGRARGKKRKDSPKDPGAEPPAEPGAGTSRKGMPWTESEHLAFLEGLRNLGKGNWRGIAQYYVPSRTPTQVASHAQKHYLRLNGATKRKSRFAALEEARGIDTKSMAAQASAAAASAKGARKAAPAPAPEAAVPLSAGMPAALPVPFPAYLNFFEYMSYCQVHWASMMTMIGAPANGVVPTVGAPASFAVPPFLANLAAQQAAGPPPPPAGKLPLPALSPRGGPAQARPAPETDDFGGASPTIGRGDSPFRPVRRGAAAEC